MARLTSRGARHETAAQQSRRLLPKKVMCRWRKASRAGVRDTVSSRRISGVSYHWLTMISNSLATSDHRLIDFTSTMVFLTRRVYARVNLIGLYVGAETAVNQLREKSGRGQDNGRIIS